MTNILLIRHGDTGLYGDEQKPEAPLNRRGNNQVKALAEKLADLDVADQLFVSPYQRAWETGSKIAESVGLEPVKDKRLIEIDLWENPVEMKKDPEFEAGLKKFKADQIRVGDVLEEIVASYINHTILVAGHGNWIRTALGYAVKMPLESIVRLGVPLASVTSLEYDDRGFYVLRRFGCTVG